MAKKLKLKRYKQNNYRWCDAKIDIPKKYDTDIELRFADGKSILIQYRVDGHSVDILFDDAVECYLYSDERIKKCKSNCRMVKQIVSIL